MSGFHYTREAGELGQVLAREGNGAGLTLDEALERNRPPLRAAMELPVSCIQDMHSRVSIEFKPFPSHMCQPAGTASDARRIQPG